MSDTVPSRPRPGLLRLVGRAVIAVTRNPIKSLTVLGLFFLVLILFYDVLTPAVFIEDVEIATNLTNKGFTGSSLLSSAIDQMRSAYLRHVQSLHATDRMFLKIIDRPYRGYETAHECNSNISLIPVDDAIFTSGLRRALMSSRALDTTIVTSKQFFSIRPLAFYIRKLLGNSPRLLIPFLYQEGDHFVIKVTPSPFVGPAQSREFNQLQEADEILSDLLLTYFTPQLTALEELYRGEDASVSSEIANNFLRDRQKSLFILAMMVNYTMEDPLSLSERPSKNIAQVPMIQYLLENIDFTLYDDYGPLLKAILANWLAQAEYAKLRYVKHETPNINTLYDRYVTPYITDLKRSARGKFLLSLLQIRYGLIDKFKDELKKDELKEGVMTNSRKEADVVWSTGDTVALQIIWLMQEGYFEDEEKVARSERATIVESLPISAKTRMELLALRAVLDAYDGDLGAYTLLPEGLFLGYPCVWYMAVSLLDQKMAQSAKQNPELSKIILDSFDRLQKRGLASYQFYDAWASAEMKAGQYDEAMAHHAEALKYAGPRNWGLLNWGWTALLKGDLPLARQKYMESLAVDPVPNAVFGVLNTLARQNDAQVYLSEYQKYVDTLRDQDYKARTVYQANALLFSCQRGLPPPANIMQPGETVVVNGIEYKDKELDDASVCLQLNDTPMKRENNIVSGPHSSRYGAPHHPRQ